MDYYSILGVGKNASQDDIKKAYKKLCMKHHPDRGGDVNKLQEINKAYEVLRDPKRRAEYDNPQPRFDSSMFNQGSPFPDGFEDIFSAGFSKRRSRTKNRDIRIPYKLPLEEVYAGRIIVTRYKLPSGKTQELEVQVPAGIKNGNIIKIAGYGDDSNDMLPRGDLLIEIQVITPQGWRVEGSDLHTTKTVSILDFILGTDLIIDTPENKSISLRIPKGSNPGTSFSITGHGLPNSNNTHRGKIFVKVNAKVPKITNEELLEKIRLIKDEIDT